MLRLLRWAPQTLGLRTLLNLVLLSVASFCIVLELQNVVRGFDVGLALAFAGFALLFGWMLARSPLPTWLAWLVFLTLGAEILFWRVGNLESSSTLLATRLIRLGADVARRPLPFPDARPAVVAGTQLWTDIATVSVRLWEWLQGIARGERLPDPVAATMTWNMAIWLLAGWSAWAVRRRHQPLEGLLPGMALVAALLAYARGDIWSLLFLAASGLILLVIAAYDANQRRWTSAGTESAEDIPNDLAVSTVPLVCLITLIAALTPSISIPEIMRLVQTRTVLRGDSSSLPESFGLVPPPPARTAFDDLRWPGLPREHLIGSGPELSKQVVMTIRTTDLYPHMPSDVAVPALFWRGITYDRYLGRGWSMTSSWTEGHAAGYVQLPGTPTGDRSVDADVEVVGEAGGLVYAAGVPIRIDHDFSIAWRSAEDFAALSVNARSFHVQASLSNVGVEQLASAGASYPEWVQERYLDLPDDVPQRVLNLARDLTATARTPYARARAIESYLRTIPYSLDVPRPPSGHDVVDYFLFDLKKGYCDYFATSMVVLARAAGLPARLAVGYAPGRLDAENGRYVVTQADAHSWPEIYFPDYGWIQFEPTSGRPSIVREQKAILPQAIEPAQTDLFAGLSLRDWKGFMPALAIPLSLLLLAIAWSLTDVWRLERMPPSSAVDRIYHRVCDSAMRLGVPLKVSDTPNEVALLLDEKLSSLSRHNPKRPEVNSAAAELRSIAGLYVTGRYSGHSLSPQDRRQAIRCWKQLRRQIWLAWLASIRERHWHW